MSLSFLYGFSFHARAIFLFCFLFVLNKHFSLPVQIYSHHAVVDIVILFTVCKLQYHSFCFSILFLYLRLYISFFSECRSCNWQGWQKHQSPSYRRKYTYFIHPNTFIFLLYSLFFTPLVLSILYHPTL